MIRRLSPVRNTRRPALPIDAGFSLPELLIVLLCLSALLAVAWPVYRQTVDARNVRSAAHQLYADLMECRSRADLLETTCSVHLTGEDRYTVMSGEVLRKTVVFPKGIRMAAYKTAFRRPVLGFNEKGHPFGGGTVVLRNEHGKEIRLVLYLHTGQMKLEEGDE